MTEKDSVILSASLTEKFNREYRKSRILLFTAPTGCGKTTAIRALLKGKTYTEISCVHGTFRVPENESIKDIVFIDDIQELMDVYEQNSFCDYVREHTDKHFILAGRGSVVPGWMIQWQFAGIMSVFKVEDLRLDRETVRKFIISSGLEVTDSELDKILETNRGYPIAVATLARRMAENGGYNSKTVAEGYLEIYRFFENSMLSRLRSELKSFCLDMAPFESFTTELASLITGESKAKDFIEELKICTGMLVSTEMDVHSFYKHAREFFRWEMEQEYSKDRINGIYNRAGLYFELKEDFGNALYYYSKGEDRTRVLRILEKNAAKHVGEGHYLELAEYYHSLSEKEIMAAPCLIQALSMICSLEMDYEGSEHWYQILKNLKEPALAREVAGRVAWLDICLPQREVKAFVESIPALYKKLADKEMILNSVTVTSNLPSVMNGGKDFSIWSLKDTEIATNIGKPLEILIGKDGVGLIDCALAESAFEKGEPAASRIMTLMSRLTEIQRRGTPDIEFAVVGLVARTQVAAGRAQDARETVLSLRERFEKNGLDRFMPNIEAFLCRIALKRNDMVLVEEWYKNRAPKDPFNISVIKRYQYLTEAMVLISMGENEKALLTLAPLEDYFKKCHRFIDDAQCHILKAIAKERLNDTSWTDDINYALDVMHTYRFTRPFSFFGGL
ncbi:MAG: hypothetical protein HUJ75_02865 [Parasporobacterium sp.]|nr:hypothetical protein [Parasporobacterium sp.]